MFILIILIFSVLLWESAEWVKDKKCNNDELKAEIWFEQPLLVFDSIISI